VTHDTINLFTYIYEKGVFKTTEVNVQRGIDEKFKLSYITAATAFRVKAEENVFTVITGHRNGKVVYWENTNYTDFLADY